MIKTLPLKVFPLTRDVNNTSYNLIEFFLLLENLSKYKHSGYIEVKDSRRSFVILIDEGMIVSYVDVTDEPVEISPLIFKFRIEEELKAIVYNMPMGFSSILRGFYLFENQIMNYNLTNYKDWESLLLKLIKKNTTGIVEIELSDQQYYLLIKSGNLFLRQDILNNNKLILSYPFYNDILLSKIKNNHKTIVNVLGIDNKELEEKLKENDLKHSLVRELELRQSKPILGVGPLGMGPGTITIPEELDDYWKSVLQTKYRLVIEGLEGEGKLELKKDPKIPSDTIYLSSDIIKKIKIRDRKIITGEKIIVYPEPL